MAYEINVGDRPPNLEEERTSPVERVSRMTRMLGSGMSRERRSEVYFGKPLKGMYPTDAPLANIHDIRMSTQRIRRLYGLSPGEQVVQERLHTDSKRGLIDELVNETSFTRKEAETFVDRYMRANNLVEVDDPVLGKYLAPRKDRG